ncbi:hypothetical protein [Caudoviricetes sp.]|nr:hypothetical protein [Caudoviricetes sp.]
MSIIKVNQRGLEQIQNEINAYSYKSGTLPDVVLEAYAKEAENNFKDFGSPEFEIVARGSKSGRPEIIILDDECFDIQ